jgi:hypothetical protein
MKKLGHPSNANPDNQTDANNENLPQSILLCSKCKSTSKHTIDTGFLEIKKETLIEKFLSDAIENVK